MVRTTRSLATTVIGILIGTAVLHFALACGTDDGQASAATDGGQCTCEPGAKGDQGPAGPAGATGPAGAAGAGSEAYYVEQVTDIVAGTTDGWVQLASVTITTTKSGANFDFLASATPNPFSMTTNCALRASVDGAGAGDGDGITSGGLARLTTISRAVNVLPGTHTVKLEGKNSSAGTGTCSFNSSTIYRGKLLVTVR